MSGDSDIVENENYKLWVELDTNFATFLGVVILVIFLIRMFFIYKNYTFNTFPLWKDSSLYLAILFGIISIIFYVLAHEYNKNAIHNCKNDKCFSQNLDAYDIFHSNWHLFTGFSIFFWIMLIKNTFNY